MVLRNNSAAEGSKQGKGIAEIAILTCKNKNRIERIGQTGQARKQCLDGVSVMRGVQPEGTASPFYRLQPPRQPGFSDGTRHMLRLRRQLSFRKQSLNGRPGKPGICMLMLSGHA